MNPEAEEMIYLDWLKKALPAADRASVPEASLREIVRHACSVRRLVPWGSAIPEDLFRTYVLFPRVNKEYPSAYHAPLWASLRDRIAGKSINEAVKEINFWCAESADYCSTDDRTNGPLEVLRLGYGRCGEESTLLVCALRACGIPARQVYVPLWSHCDDNHAWVEVFVDGAWHYLGACEPEPTLDSGWFTAAASRAMLVQTRAWGELPEGDEGAGKLDGAWIVNRTAAYGRTALLTIRVLKDGAPMAGVLVRFELANMGGFAPIHAQQTGADGTLSIRLGLGSVRVHATDGRCFQARMLDLLQDTELRFDWVNDAEYPAEKECFRQVPPHETRIQPSAPSPELRLAHEARLRHCAALLAQKRAAFSKESEYLIAACGNAGQIQRFLTDSEFCAGDKRALLDTLREKDFGDATAEMLRDALSAALPYRSRYPEAVWREGVLAPRIADEKLLPIRSGLRACLRSAAPETPEALWTWLQARMECSTERDFCTPNLLAALQAGRCSAETLDILFVACARALGFAARRNPFRKEIEIWSDGSWKPLLPEAAVRGSLRLVNPGEHPLTAGVHFSVGMLRGGAFELLNLSGMVLTDSLELPLPEGRCRITVLTRQPDGSIDGTLIPFEIHSGERTEATLCAPPVRLPEHRTPAPLPELHVFEHGTPVDLLASLGGRPALIALLSPAEEPSVHLLNELAELAGAENQFEVRLLLPGEAGETDSTRLEHWKQRLPGCRIFTLPDSGALIPWRKALEAGELRLPFAAAVDAEGRGLFAFAGYHVGSVRILAGLLSQQSDSVGTAAANRNEKIQNGLKRRSI